MTAPDSMPVNAIRGLLDALARLIGQYRPGAVACAWDDDWRPGWRVDLVPSYKTHRLAEVVAAGGVAAEEAPDQLAIQVPWIVKVLTALDLPVVGCADHEADDVLGSLVAASGGGWVVTGDRDLFQLAGAGATVVYVGRGVAKHELVDSAWVEAKYGVRADQYVDFAVLRGDPSDGLPGVAGVGDKTAARLVSTHGDLEGILQAAGDPSSPMAASLRSKLASSIDYLAAARQVVAVVCDLPVPAVRPLSEATIDRAAMDALDARLGLGSSRRRIEAALQACGARST